MKKDEFKQSIDDSIKPDYYLKSRLSAKVLYEKPKHKNKKPFIAGLSTALCAVFVVCAIAFGNFANNAVDNSTTNNPVSSNAENFFVLNVSAAEDENLPINDSAVTLPDYKLQVEDDTLYSSSNTALTVNGSNIKSVKYQCTTGTLDITDVAKAEYLKDNNEFYDIIVPYNDEYDGLNYEQTNELFYNHIQNGDYDKYFVGVKKKDIDDYYKVDRIYDDSKGDDYIVSLGLLTSDTWEQCYAYNVKEYTFVNYTNETESIGNPVWQVDSEMMLSEFNSAKDVKFSELPHDTITVTVTFNDDSVQTQSYDYSFNDNGNLVVEKL
jgi:hypothetical protein